MAKRRFSGTTYFSVDIEADGRVPGLSSMLSFGAAAFNEAGAFIEGFTRNLEQLADASPEPETSEFWAKNQAAWVATRKDTVPPLQAMQDFIAWVESIAKDTRPVFIGYPAIYDFKWIDYYCVRFAGRNPFGFSGCIDIKTVAWTLLGGELSEVRKAQFPGAWRSTRRHTHIALDDAIEQGELFFKILATRTLIVQPLSRSGPVRPVGKQSQDVGNQSQEGAVMPARDASSVPDPLPVPRTG